MNDIRMGRSGLKVNRLCLGTMNFGPFSDECETFRNMDAALDAGINFFDTANHYGNSGHSGEKEEIIGRWLFREGARGKMLFWRRKYITPWMI